MGLKDILAAMTRKPRGSDKYAKFMEGYSPVFTQFGTDVYASDIVQGAIDAIATECSKLQPRHIRQVSADKIDTVKGSINRLLKVSPNEMMTTRDFLEKIIWQLYLNSNAFIYPTYRNVTDSRGNRTREYTGFYPLNPLVVEFIQDESGGLFIRFTFQNSDKFTLPYSDVIHLRKRFSLNEVMGGGLNGQPDNAGLLKMLETDNIVIQGLGKAIKSGLTLRGIVRINTMLDDQAQLAERQRFESALDSSKSGIMALDLKGDYIPLATDPKVIDKDTMSFIQDRILNNIGVSYPIFCGKFTDEDYQAFYEKTLEPLIISLGQAFSKCLFTQRELDLGNEIAFYPQKLLFTNIKNKLAAADILGNRGALTNNALLDIFGYPPYEGGEVRLVSLNYVDVNIANEYQMQKAKAAATPPPAEGEKKDVTDKTEEPAE
jgi:HK97 family phage portal protein